MKRATVSPSKGVIGLITAVFPAGRFDGCLFPLLLVAI
jgi:hypothetical protein